jgi:hypothetical protein
MRWLVYHSWKQTIPLFLTVARWILAAPHSPSACRPFCGVWLRDGPSTGEEADCKLFDAPLMGRRICSGDYRSLKYKCDWYVKSRVFAWIKLTSKSIVCDYVLLLLLLSSSSSSLSPLCRVFIHIFLRQTVSLRNTTLQLFCHCCLWCSYH